MYRVGDKLKIVTSAWDNLDWCKKGAIVSLNAVDSEDDGMPYLVFPLGSTSTTQDDGIWLPQDAVELVPRAAIGDKLKVITDTCRLPLGTILIVHHIDPEDTETPYLCKLKESGRLERYWMDAKDVELFQETQEAVKVIEPVVFKTQQDIWKYLSESEEHKVTFTDNGDTVGFKDGVLYTYPDGYVAHHSFNIPKNWKPYSKKKDWWELNGNMPTACWYGDGLNEETGKPVLLGFITRDLENSCFRLSQGGCSWRFAVPLTEEEFKEYLLSEQLK